MPNLRPNRPNLAAEHGTTLAELLVVILLLGIIGSITTTGIVRSFRTQLAAVNVAETLDGTRIATQRVRDFVRGADEICASSTATSLVLWTDDDGDGVQTNAELDIFELVADPLTGDDIFRRRVPVVGSETIQLIRDDIISSALFTYEPEPDEQTTNLTCTHDGVAPSGAFGRTSVVDVTFEVANPGGGAPLTTATSIRLRNAGLSGTSGNQPPTASYTVTCNPGLSCTFDASASNDADGTIADWEWDFGDGTTDTGEVVTHTFPATGPYDVRLVVTDDEGDFGFEDQEVNPVPIGGNIPPTAEFTFSCIGRDCSFDGSASNDPDGTIVSYDWDFGDGNSATGATPSRTYASDGTYDVVLTVTDDGGATGVRNIGIVAGGQTIRIAGLTADGSNANSWAASIDVQVERTTAGSNIAGILVTGSLSGAATGNVSCTTGATGSCEFEGPALSGLPKDESLTLVVTQVNDTRSPAEYSYDPTQNIVNRVTVSRGQNNAQGTP